MAYNIVAQNEVAMTESRVHVLRHAEHGVRWAIRTDSSAQLWDLFVIVMKGFTNLR